MTVRSKSPGSLILDVTVHLELEMEFVYMYVSNSTTYDIWLAYSNSVCELLILRIHKPALIIILMYHPPTCSPEDFNDIISRSRAIMLSMSSPLPNIIMLGDFNFPDINWLNPDYNCPDASPLILFSHWLFLNQQVTAPTSNSNILDSIFSHDDLINCIDITDSVISDHRIITAKTSIPISQSAHPCQTMNFTMLLDFRKTDWLDLCDSIKSVNWKVLLHDCIPSKYLSVIIETLENVCSIHVPAKHSKKNYVSKFHIARKIFMRKRSKLNKICEASLQNPQNVTQNEMA